MTTLILKKTASIYGMGDGNDWTVLDGDRIIGRIFLSPQSPPDRNWMWTITARDYPRSIHTRGYCATREEAMADLAAARNFATDLVRLGGRTKTEAPMFS